VLGIEFIRKDIGKDGIELVAIQLVIGSGSEN